MNNISRNISADGTSAAPSAYKIKRITLSNHKGKSLDIQNAVTKTVITESIYSNTLICKVSVRDETNLVQEFPLIGQEKLNIKMSSRNGNDEKIIDLTFYITEYPLFGRSTNERVQAWSFSGISEHAYISKFKRISKSIKGPTSDAISDIFKSDLNSNKLVLGSTPITVFKGIINTQTPLSAAEWLRAKTYDDQQAPYYLFETLKGEVHLKSHSDLISQDAYFDYIDSRHFNYEPNSKEDYLQRKHRILEIASDLKMSKIFQAMNGAFASNNFYLDLSDKSFTSTQFSYNLESNTLGKKKSFSPEFSIDNETIDLKYDSHHEYISTNRFAYDEEYKNYNELKKDSGGITQSYIENFETITHDVKLFGDFDLNAGTIIEINIPKATDPSVQRKVLTDKYGRFDKHLSGKYLITSAIHTFENGDYFTNVKVKRDSFTIDL